MSAKTAVVTGGGMGLGRATAITLAKAGYKVAVLGRTRSKLEATAEIIGDACLPIQAELTNPDEVRGAFAQVDRAFGRLDALVNNAAAYRLFKIEEATDAQIEEVVAGSLKNSIYTMREAIPRMRAIGGGAIVNVSSEAVELPAPYLLMYTAAKAALESLTRGLRGELRGANIRCMVFRAGVISESSSAVAAGPDLSAAFGEAFIGGGFAVHYASGPLSPEVMAASIAHMITSPADANIELMSLRRV
jgi:NAD(P)-dependent dehydrogenase (short-subunit alcohol dehydrogenase family)